MFDDTMSFGDENEVFSPPRIEEMWQKKTVVLLNKKTDVKTEFTVYNESALKFMHKGLIADKTVSIAKYPMDKLEVEYDYETDEEQIYRAKKYLVAEQAMSVEFCIKDDPLVLVSNLKYAHPFNMPIN